MKRVLLIDLYALPEYDISLALGYLKASADADPVVKSAWTVDLLHLPVSTPAEKVAEAVAASGADLVGLSCYSWNIRAVERGLALVPPGKGPMVILGGIEVTPDPAGYLKKVRCASAVVFGEGEITFRELLLRLKDGPGSLDGLLGVAYRDGAAIKRNAGRPPIADLSTVPSPYLEGSYGDLLRGQDRVMVETTRGCPYTCTFCFEPRGFAKVRSFPMKRAQEEIRAIVAAGVKEIVFLDTNFNMDRKRAVEMWRFLASLGGGVRYAFELRGELLDAEQARALSALDYFAEIGLQSIHQRSLDAVKRWYEPTRFADGVGGLLDAGIYRPCAASTHGGVSVDLMMGLPHETVADLLASFDWVFSRSPSTVVLTLTKILPGTELYDDARKFQYEFDPGEQYEVTSSKTIDRKDIAAMLRFREAVEFAYNRLHAVRTIAWLARGLRCKPSDVFMALGERMEAAKGGPADLGVKDLAAHLGEIARARGDSALAEGVADRLNAENMLNVLQRNRETKRTWWRNMTFGAGFRFLTRFGGLPPLPDPLPVQAPDLVTQG
jgi:radical SAM superfamily enzyme YgiQ (UPF0313 family)